MPEHGSYVLELLLLLLLLVVVFVIIVLLQKYTTNGHTFSSIVHGDIDVELCKIAEAAGIQLADALLKTEAAEILKEAKEQTAKAVIEEQARKEKMKK